MTTVRSSMTNVRSTPLPIGAMVKLISITFRALGVLPFFLVIAIVVFTFLAPHFLTIQNLTNVGRQSVYLVLVSLGQMLVLIAGGFDLSVGTAIALTSVVSTTAMVALGPSFPGTTWLVVIAGATIGFLSAAIIGVVNAVGVSRFNVPPFIMTLGAQSVGAGIALFVTGGVPITGIPHDFVDTFGFGQFVGVPIPVLIAASVGVIKWVAMNRTKFGMSVYAVGGNTKAANLSGINTKSILFLAYAICTGLASLAGLLLTARVGSGETNLGGTIALESIAPLFYKLTSHKRDRFGTRFV